MELTYSQRDRQYHCESDNKERKHMLFERIESEGLSHYSYLVGSRGEALVIDPRRDIDVYIERTERNGYRLRHIIETHRNEDYLIGSVELAGRTGAAIWHADGHLPYRYGNPVKEGQQWRIGANTLQAVSTPGHTAGSFSYVLSEPDGKVTTVFSGDTLFAGDTGRCDLSGEDKTEEMAGLLYDSIFKKLLTLGDGVILCPAHGEGSVCGSAISDRAWTTIGIERVTNPKLQHTNREDFIRAAGVNMEKPYYFKQMEQRNLTGLPELNTLAVPPALSPSGFAEAAQESLVLDARLDGYGAAHIPGSLHIWPDGVSRFAGWFLPADMPVLLVCDICHLQMLVIQLRRMGFDRINGYLAGGISAWYTAGHETAAVNTVTVPNLCHSLDEGDKTWILDVRSQEEIDKEGIIPGAQHIHLTQLAGRSKEVPADRPVFIFCGSGRRSMVAASLLKRQGWLNLTVVLGGFSAWKSVSCPVRATKTSADTE